MGVGSLAQLEAAGSLFLPREADFEGSIKCFLHQLEKSLGAFSALSDDQIDADDDQGNRPDPIGDDA